MEAGDGAAVDAEEPRMHKISPFLPQKLWLKAMRCDEMLHSEKGDATHHTRRKKVISTSKTMYGNGGSIDGWAESSSAIDHAGPSERLKFRDD
jgi:hypothetical protein